MADWQEPESEEEFERVVQRAERARARGDVAAEPDETEFMELDPLDDHDFEELVRDALDDLPDLLRPRSRSQRRRRDLRRRAAPPRLRALPGRRRTRDDVPDRIVIFRDTLRRDFGHDPELLREQVTITVRHELAHHIGLRRARGTGAGALGRVAGWDAAQGSRSLPSS